MKEYTREGSGYIEVRGVAISKRKEKFKRRSDQYWEENQKFYSKQEKRKTVRSTKPKSKFISMDFDELPRATVSRGLQRTKSERSVVSRQSYPRPRRFSPRNSDDDVPYTSRSKYVNSRNKSPRDSSEDEDGDDRRKMPKPKSKWIESDDGMRIRNFSRSRSVDYSLSDEVEIRTRSRESNRQDFEVSIDMRRSGGQQNGRFPDDQTSEYTDETNISTLYLNGDKGQYNNQDTNGYSDTSDGVDRDRGAHNLHSEPRRDYSPSNKPRDAFDNDSSRRPRLDENGETVYESGRRGTYRINLEMRSGSQLKNNGEATPPRPLGGQSPPGNQTRRFSQAQERVYNPSPDARRESMRRSRGDLNDSSTGIRSRDYPVQGSGSRDRHVSLSQNKQQAGERRSDSPPRDIQPPSPNTYRGKRDSPTRNRRQESPYRDLRLPSPPTDKPQHRSQDSPPRDKRRDDSPRDRKKDSSPKNRRRDSSPRDRGRDSSPRNRGRDSSPRNRRRDSSPRDKRRDSPHRDNGRDSSPKDRKRDSSPRDRKQDSLPRDKRRDSSPRDKRRDSSPRDKRRDSSPTDRKRPRDVDNTQRSPPPDSRHDSPGNNPRENETYKNTPKDMDMTKQYDRQGYDSKERDRNQKYSTKSKAHNSPKRDYKTKDKSDRRKHESGDRRFENHGERSPARERSGTRQGSPSRERGPSSPHRDRGSRSPHRDRRQRSPDRDRRQRSPDRDRRQRSPDRDRRQRSPSRDRAQCSPSTDRRQPRDTESDSTDRHTRRNSPSRRRGRTMHRFDDYYNDEAHKARRKSVNNAEERYISGTADGVGNSNDDHSRNGDVNVERPQSDNESHDVRFDSATRKREQERSRRPSCDHGPRRADSPYVDSNSQNLISGKDRESLRNGENGEKYSQEPENEMKDLKPRYHVRRHNGSKGTVQRRASKSDKQSDIANRETQQFDSRNREEVHDRDGYYENQRRSREESSRRMGHDDKLVSESESLDRNNRDGRISADSLDGGRFESEEDAEKRADDRKVRELRRQSQVDRYSDQVEDNDEIRRNRDAEVIEQDEDNAYTYNNYEYGMSNDYSINRSNDNGQENGEMLEQSAEELKTTVEELEKRFDAIENEDEEHNEYATGNEWKTRFETQTEMNQQLERQILMLENKVEEARKNLKDAGKTPQGGKLLDDLADANPQMVKNLEREKMSLMNQIRDLEWRLDQESKAYHKANDERKQYVIEINATKGNIYHLQRQRAAGDATYRTPRENGGNIPDDQRILDPKKGPIRKTAAVKSLPSLERI